MEAEDNKNRKGLWSEEEDRVLLEHINVHGIGQWNRIPNLTGLKRCGKSCRLRWLNYLSPNVKRGCFSEEEDDLIIRLHKLLGNKWSLIAGRVPGRTDNQVKNHWNTHLSKRLGISSASSTTIKKQSKIISKKVHTKKVPTNINPDYSHINVPISAERSDREQQCRDNYNVVRGEAIDKPVEGESESSVKKKADICPESMAIMCDDQDFSNNHGVVKFMDGYFIDLVDEQMYWQRF